GRSLFRTVPSSCRLSFLCSADPTVGARRPNERFVLPEQGRLVVGVFLRRPRPSRRRDETDHQGGHGQIHGPAPVHEVTSPGTGPYERDRNRTLQRWIESMIGPHRPGASRLPGSSCASGEANLSVLSDRPFRADGFPLILTRKGSKANEIYLTFAFLRPRPSTSRRACRPASRSTKRQRIIL